MKNKKKFIIFTLVTVVFIIAAITTVLIPKTKVYKSKASGAGGITLSLSPSVNLRINQSQRVDIKAEGNKDIDSFSIVLLVNSTYFDVSDIKINAPFEQLENKIGTVSTSMKKITIAGILPPGNVSPTVAGPFILGSFLVKGIVLYNEPINIPFATSDPRFQIAKGGNAIQVSSADPIKICVQSTSNNCLPVSTICGDKPDQAIIKYPLAAPMIITDSRVVTYFEVPNDGCPSKEYQVSITNSNGGYCSTDWLPSTTSNPETYTFNGVTKMIEKVDLPSSNCRTLPGDASNTTLKVSIRSGGASGTISDVTREFKYVASGSVPDNFPGGFWTYGGTDVGVTSSFSRTGRNDDFVNNYVKNGEYVSSPWNIVLMPHYSGSAASSHNALDYTAKKTKEMAINYPTKIRGIGTDDAYGLPLSVGYTLSAFKNDAVGGGRLALTFYDDSYTIGSSDNIGNISGAKLAIIFYPHHKDWDYTKSFKTVRDYWGVSDDGKGKGADVIMYAGLYPRVMKGFHGPGTWMSLSEDITNSCKNAKAALALKNLGPARGANGIEIYDQSPTNCDVPSPTPYNGSYNGATYTRESKFCYIDKIISDITTVILTGGDVNCDDPDMPNRYCRASSGIGTNCP